MLFIGINFFRGIWGLLMFPLAILAGWWTYRDVEGTNRKYPWLWAGISFSFFPVGFFVYVIYRVFARNKI